MIGVASYNIRKAIGTDRRRDPERTAEVLRELDADIVALQEADRRFGARKSALSSELLAEHTPYHAVPFGMRPGSLGWHGNAILVRRTAEILDHAPIEIPALEPRGAVMADIRVHGVELRVVGMHLDLSGLWRRRQVRAILDQLQRRRALPTILMGDLNEWTLHGGCLREFAHGFRLAQTGRSFHSRRPVACLDRIIVSPDLHVIAAGVHRTQRSSTASDHLPIWARLTS